MKIRITVNFPNGPSCWDKAYCPFHQREEFWRFGVAYCALLKDMMNHPGSDEKHPSCPALKQEAK